MTPRPLPVNANIERWTDQGRRVHGSVTVSGMARLVELLADGSGEAEADLHFHHDASPRPVITGQIRAKVRLTCQRCLEPMDWEARIEVRLGIISTEAEATGLPEEYDPFLLEDELIHLPALVEDEIILGLPAVALHEGSERCRPAALAAAKRPDDDRPNPFSVLQELRQRDD